MAMIYKIDSSPGGRGFCGHKQKKGEPYYLVDGVKTSRVYCNTCGVKAGMDAKVVSVKGLIDKGVLSEKH